MRDYNLKYPRPGFIECEDTDYFNKKSFSICTRKSKGSAKDKIDIIGSKKSKDRKRLIIRSSQSNIPKKATRDELVEQLKKLKYD